MDKWITQNVPIFILRDGMTNITDLHGGETKFWQKCLLISLKYLLIIPKFGFSKAIAALHPEQNTIFSLFNSTFQCLPFNKTFN